MLPARRSRPSSRSCVPVLRSRHAKSTGNPRAGCGGGRRAGGPAGRRRAEVAAHPAARRHRIHRAAPGARGAGPRPPRVDAQPRPADAQPERRRLRARGGAARRSIAARRLREPQGPDVGRGDRHRHQPALDARSGGGARRRDRPLHVRVVDRRVPAVSHRRHRRGRPGPAHRRSPAGSAQLRRLEGTERADRARGLSGARSGRAARLHRRARRHLRPLHLLAGADRSRRRGAGAGPQERLRAVHRRARPGRLDDRPGRWRRRRHLQRRSARPCHRPWRSSSRGCGRWRPAR